MSLIALIVIGAAVGVLATRLMKLNTDVPTTIALGVGGALIGGFLLRFLLVVTSWMAGFVGAVLGAVVLIWLWKTYIGK